MRNTSIKSVTLTDFHWEKTNDRLKSSQIFEGSHRGENANQVGILGEVVIEQWFEQYKITYSNCTSRTDFDYQIANTTIDVKTKDRTVPPKRNYECSIPLYNHVHQKPDYYLFVSLQRNKNDPDTSIRRFTDAYIIGGVHQNELGRIGKVWNKGQTDPSNGTTFWTDCINIKMGDLIPLKEMVEIFNKK